MSAALLKLDVSVTANGADIDRATLAMTIGAWLELIPAEYRSIETVNANGERVLIKVNCATSCR